MEFLLETQGINLGISLLNFLYFYFITPITENYFFLQPPRHVKGQVPATAGSNLVHLLCFQLDNLLLMILNIKPITTEIEKAITINKIISVNN